MPLLSSPARPRHIVEIICLTIALLAPFETRAVDVYSPAALAMLPSYCPNTLLFRERVPGGDNPAKIQRWYVLMGESFRHMHHYCWALWSAYQAKLARTTLDRQRGLDASIREFNYVMSNVQPDFVLLPEILMNRGESLIGVGKVGPGLTDLKRAIELKTDYWPPYVQLGDYYKQVGDVAKSREWIEKGLSFSPNSRTLRGRLAELDEAKTKPDKGAPVAGKSRPAAKPRSFRDDSVVPPKQNN